MRFFDSYFGMYLVQSVVHSIVALLIVEMSLRIWEVEWAYERFRYRLLVLVLPLVMFPIFQIISPHRGSFFFVEDTAIFSTLRWLKIMLFGNIPLAFPFLFILASVAIVAIVQEVIPIVKDMTAKDEGNSDPGRSAGAEIEDMVDEMSGVLKIERPDVVVIDDVSPIIYTAGTRTHAIVLSEPLLRVFNRQQLKSALAHELAHIVRRSTFTTLLVFIVRICLFYNPVSLLEFRRLVQDDEHICDDITVSLTGDPHALASALKAFCLDIPHRDVFRVADLKEAIGSSSHNLLLKERIARLEQSRGFGYHPYWWGRYGLTMTVIVVLNYFIV